MRTLVGSVTIAGTSIGSLAERGREDEDDAGPTSLLRGTIRMRSSSARSMSSANCSGSTDGGGAVVSADGVAVVAEIGLAEDGAFGATVPGGLTAGFVTIAGRGGA